MGLISEKKYRVKYGEVYIRHNGSVTGIDAMGLS